MNLPCHGCFGILVAVSSLTAASWSPDPGLVDQMSRQRPGINYVEGRVPSYRLPDPLRTEAGRPVASAQVWTASRRPELLALFRDHVYGRSPGRPDRMEFDPIDGVLEAMDGAARLHRARLTVVLPGGRHTWETTLFLPRQATREHPVPVFLLLNNRSATNADPARLQRSGFWPAEAVVARGYGIASFQVGDVDPDRVDGKTQGVRGKVSGGEYTWGTLAAWAWGASRVLDWLETVPGVEASRVAAVGHSRGGKAALWAGAEDPRFAMLVANGSGCGGAALSRRRFGETVAAINRTFPHWFNVAFKAYNDREDTLPIDQHQLVALAAPRPVYIASAAEDLWADPRGEYLSLVHAAPVYRLWGLHGVAADAMPEVGQPVVTEATAYHIRPGGHDLTPYEWQQFMDFADRVWGRR